MTKCINLKKSIIRFAKFFIWLCTVLLLYMYSYYSSTSNIMHLLYIAQKKI